MSSTEEWQQRQFWELLKQYQLEYDIVSDKISRVISIEKVGGAAYDFPLAPWVKNPEKYNLGENGTVGD